jgi:hypothetical protein
VVVSAKKAGSIVTVSVVTDAQGRYSFPASRLAAGKYTLNIRAIGYELAAPTGADVADEQTTTVHLKLSKAKDLASQMSNAEWMMSLPGTEEDKSFLLGCVGCHTLERVVRSSHNADEWAQVIVRMNGYGPVSQPVKPQPMLDPERSGSPDQFRKQAESLSPGSSEPSLAVGVSAQDAAAPHRPGNPGHHHRVRHAATHDRAARRSRG